jgi:formate dehydrogenase subunit gamma
VRDQILTSLDHINLAKEVVSDNEDTPGPLIEILHEVQRRLGYIPPSMVPTIAECLNLSRAEIHGVISFYHFFRSAPPGRHIVKICRAEACQAMGSGRLEEHAKESLNIEYHETTKDGSITLEPVYCLGNCACAPAIRIDDTVHANVDAKVFDLLTMKLSQVDLEGKN